MDVQLIRMTAEEAVTLSKTIETTVQTAIKEHSAATVTSEVADASAALTQAVSPLADIPTVTFDTRREVDKAAYKALAGTHNILQGYVQAYSQVAVELSSTEDNQREAATFLLNTLFPSGTGFLKDNWYLQYGATELLLQRANTKEAITAVQLVGLGSIFELLKRIHTEYGQRMGFSRAVGDGADDLLNNWYEALEQYLATVTVHHNRGSELRELLHNPYDTLAATIREQRRKERLAAGARRKEKEANETTGSDSENESSKE